jgi:hypothetical protein
MGIFVPRQPPTFNSRRAMIIVDDCGTAKMPINNQAKCPLTPLEARSFKQFASNGVDGRFLLAPVLL